MGWWKILFLLIWVGCVSASTLIELKPTTHNDYMKNHTLVIMEYYAHWCPYCKKLAPTYKEAASASDVPFAKMNCADNIANKVMCTKLKINGYPTVLAYRDHGKSTTEYMGRRTKDKILQFVGVMKKGESPPFDDTINADTAPKCLLKDEEKWKKRDKE